MKATQPIIRYAILTDLPQMYAISQRVHQLSYATLIPDARRAEFEKRYTPSAKSQELYSIKMTSRIKDDTWYIWVAESNNIVIGYTLAQQVNDMLIQKRGLFVDLHYHGQGIGSTLFKKSLEIASKGCVVRLSVIENNYTAKRLYTKYGFTFVEYDDKIFYGARLEVMEYVGN